MGNSSAKVILKRVWTTLKTFFNRIKNRKSIGQIKEEIETVNLLGKELNGVELTAFGLGGIIGN